ncbi:MAG: hypothetical protein U0235_18665 [Polyangiaceae bacterium]
MNQRTNPRAHESPLHLGVDIGRVLCSGEGADTSFFAASDEEALRTPEVPFAVEALARLVPRLSGRVWLVSKCGPKIERRTRAWLAAIRFHERTGVPAAHVHFCRERRDKAPICQRLGIQCFVDDRADVLSAMEGIVQHRLLFGPQRGPIDRRYVAVPTWREGEAIIGELIAARSRAATGAPAERGP